MSEEDPVITVFNILKMTPEQMKERLESFPKETLIESLIQAVETLKAVDNTLDRILGKLRMNCMSESPNTLEKLKQKVEGEIFDVENLVYNDFPYDRGLNEGQVSALRLVLRWIGELMSSKTRCKTCRWFRKNAYGDCTVWGTTREDCEEHAVRD